MNELTPYLPSPSLNGKRVGLLLQNLEELYVRICSMNVNIHPVILNEVKSGIGFVNNYYSNKIESEGTHPVDIEKAMHQNFSQEREKELNQRTALAYQEAQDFVIFEENKVDFDLEFASKIHQKFYDSKFLFNEQLFVFDSNKNKHQITPGEYRKKNVVVGRHTAPEFKDIERLMRDFSLNYSFKDSDSGAIKLMKTFSAHHRFMFIHPFLDGNGRTGRLMTDAMIKSIAPDSYGLWSLSRGLARNSNKYKAVLASADKRRQGSIDGRGLRTELGLIDFIEFMTKTSLDQVNFMSSKLGLNSLFNRLQKYVQFSEKNIPSEYIKLVPELLIQGEIAKSNVQEILNCSERKARDIVKTLKEHNLLKEKNESKFSPITLNFNSELMSFLFPDLIPFKHEDDNEKEWEYTPFR